ncbi:MAG: nicotinate (nicotinamide) nucleotide adenylyltransferase [Spirochaetes bacterium GWF1_31_7]|nr:MAG: nicotinate (nicotinamide) nucleotide adenylyltransferase [Spirochaetes bacterium GWE1_32_154]OHD44903.1 MAG: nicotinate (nicotinamide) nucleotide adenylyltransferase [Spirochaetes bacterium GWE2_31_10]OHD48846.1 MAG: nicotinate (nicotinamide) nucleotide adenylyltransferase [Spirochaetes bacterium GWF1_31_7]OHD78299.1 MAG: nicotinate (nicotinamide) nucleotide adenylyltransferase [Spirochaetes bacterium RIFOXYB1_FULL_32_8]HBD92661.1 nicotinate (nicotinamide) nucleotide adenylyltransferase
MKIAIYGGTFNPIHFGHLLSAQFVAETLDYDQIYFVPAHIPVHKNTSNLIDGFHRLKMIELAITSIPQFSILDIELKRGGNSYTIDTIESLINETNIDSKIGIIIGDDLIDGLSTWKSFEKLQKLTDIICLTRKNRSYDNIYNVQFLHNNIYEFSSTEIRKRIINKRNIDFMVPNNVKNYIESNGLYQN